MLLCLRDNKTFRLLPVDVLAAGQRSSPLPAVMALISLDDLEGLDEEQLDDDIADNPEPMEEDDRLLTRWEAIASTHHVSVPPGEGGRGQLFALHTLLPTQKLCDL